MLQKLLCVTRPAGPWRLDVSWQLQKPGERQRTRFPAREQPHGPARPRRAALSPQPGDGIEAMGVIGQLLKVTEGAQC